MRTDLAASRIAPWARNSAADGASWRVQLVRVGNDVAGFVSDDGYVFGYVLTDPSSDDGIGGHGYRPVPYCLPPGNTERMAQLVIQQWGNSNVTSIVGWTFGWPLVKVAGVTHLSCPHCLGFNVSEETERGGFAYCHGCGKASDS